MDMDDESHTGKSYSDLTGRFPAKSQQGNLYVLILYTCDDNAILAKPLKTRSDADQLKAYEAILTRAKRGTALTMHWMDNEASTTVKRLLTKQFQLEYQLVPPHTHQRNAAKRAICTFKNHFIAGLCSADTDFPIRLWDQLIPQAKITIDLMRESRANPSISACEGVFGPFNHNWTLLAPPGCEVLIHEKPDQHKSCDLYGVKGGIWAWPWSTIDATIVMWLPHKPNACLTQLSFSPGSLTHHPCQHQRQPSLQQKH
jgi:hypothetical protein